MVLVKSGCLFRMGEMEEEFASHSIVTLTLDPEPSQPSATPATDNEPEARGSTLAPCSLVSTVDCHPTGCTRFPRPSCFTLVRFRPGRPGLTTALHPFGFTGLPLPSGSTVVLSRPSFTWSSKPLASPRSHKLSALPWPSGPAVPHCVFGSSAQPQVSISHCSTSVASSLGSARTHRRDFTLAPPSIGSDVGFSLHGSDLGRSLAPLSMSPIVGLPSGPDLDCYMVPPPASPGWCIHHQDTHPPSLFDVSIKVPGGTCFLFNLSLVYLNP